MSTPVAKNTIEIIIISAVYTGCYSVLQICCPVVFMTCWHKLKWFSTVALSPPVWVTWTLAVAVRRVRCRHGVTNLSRRTKASSASDRRPSTPWVLSSAGKLIRYLHLLLLALSFRRCFPLLFFIFVLCTEHSLLHIMSRHTPYCWLASSSFWYSAPAQFYKAFFKNDIPLL